jgi:hypothetical protein
LEAATEPDNKQASGRARRVAFVVVLVVFALMQFFLSPLPYAVLGWFLEPEVVSHRIHQTSFGAIFALSLVGAISLLRAPERKIAPAYQVVLPIYLTLAAVVLLDRQFDPIIGVFLVVPALLVALHPARRLLLRPPLDPSRVLAVLALIAAIPLVVFAVDEVRIGQQGSTVARAVQEDLPPDASERRYDNALRRSAQSAEVLEAARHYGHWSAMGAFALSIAALAVVASLRVPGWRLGAWSAGLALALYGVSSLAAPSDASASPAAWALLAIAWGVAFIAVSERERRSEATRVNAATA